jgi:hypothetical protein
MRCGNLINLSESQNQLNQYLFFGSCPKLSFFSVQPLRPLRLCAGYCVKKTNHRDTEDRLHGENPN